MATLKHGRCAEARMGSLEKRQAKFDKSLVAIRKLILTGMKMVNQVTASQKLAQAELREIRDDIRGLTSAQKRTDEKSWCSPPKRYSNINS